MKTRLELGGTKGELGLVEQILLWEWTEWQFINRVKTGKWNSTLVTLVHCVGITLVTNFTIDYHECNMVLIWLPD